jgi:hypothetical protein
VRAITFMGRAQQDKVLIKKKFGLFKANTIAKKRTRQCLLFLVNHLSKPYDVRTRHRLGFKQRSKVFFYKKFNRLHFRSGRALLRNFWFIKKYMIQKYITKKINTSIKKN